MFPNSSHSFIYFSHIQYVFIYFEHGVIEKLDISVSGRWLKVPVRCVKDSECHSSDYLSSKIICVLSIYLSLCSPGCPDIVCVPSSSSQVLVLQMCTILLDFIYNSFMHLFIYSFFSTGSYGCQYHALLTYSPIFTKRLYILPFFIRHYLCTCFWFVPNGP